MDEPTSEPGKRRVVLTRKDSFALMTWLSTQRDRLTKQALGIRQIAAEAAAALKIRVTRGHVAGCLEDLGIDTPMVVAGRPRTMGLLAALEVERKRVDDLAGNQTMFSEELAKSITRLNANVERVNLLMTQIGGLEARLKELQRVVDTATVLRQALPVPPKKF